VALVNFDPSKTPDADPASTGTHFVFTIPADQYKALRFGVGVPANLDGPNAKQSVTYEFGHPLSVSQGMVWTMDNTYRYIVLEGRGYKLPAQSARDTVPFQYHLRVDPDKKPALYQEVEFSDEFKGDNGSSRTKTISLDMNRVFYAPDGSNTINVTENNATDMTGDPQIQLGLRIADNFRKALSIQ
jgi:hypothetical protein